MTTHYGMNTPGSALAKNGDEELYPTMPVQVTVQDNAGRNQTLYLAGDEMVKSHPALVAELPPQAPEFDARYASNRMVETFVPVTGTGNDLVYPISVTTGNYPVTVRWSVDATALKGGATKILLVTSKSHKVLANVSDKARGSYTLKSPLAEGDGIGLRLTNDVKAALPKTFALSRNYPNPFNPETHVVVDLPKAVTDLEVTVYDLLGQKVATLINSGDLSDAGSHELTWHATDSHQLQVPSGIYFIRMNVPSEHFSQVQKVMLMK